MKILVLGACGQLGKELCISLKEKGYNYVGANSKECDITKLELLIEYMSLFKPDVVVNCAAYTQVDTCEEYVDLAYAVNAIGAKNVAIAANKTKSKLIYISTDYVFDGEKNEPYSERDTVNPLSVYGRSKLAGEEYIKNQMNEYFIIRTSWLYGHYGKNFVNTMLNLSNMRQDVAIVSDQIGTPTSIRDLVKVILMIAPTERYGVYHCSNEGECSWYEFAQKIFVLSNKCTIVNKISSKEFGAKAIRPSYSVFDKSKLKQEFNYIMPNWVDSLKEFLDIEMNRS